jgi:hypothetical protein
MNLTTPHDDLCAHLQACEQAVLDPALRRDRSRVSALLAEDFLEFGSSGRVWTREQILELLETEDYQPPVMEDFKCAFIADGVALVTYRTVRTDALTSENVSNAAQFVVDKRIGNMARPLPSGNTDE